MTIDDARDDVAERARRKKLAAKLGWKLVGRTTAEVPVERTVEIGPRAIIIRGRVSIPLPHECSAKIAEDAIAPLVDPLVGQFVHAMTRAAAKLLSEADDVAAQMRFEQPSFFRALEDARRTLLRVYGELENARVDARVEADLGLRFYLESFRRGTREVVYFAGPTNSGKTHAALEILGAAATGTYLAPLRLLALEVQERLEGLGVPTSLVTGEERVLVEGARHVSSTVEMVDLGREVDVAVIDEAQMLADDQRGWAWTLAVAGVRARTVILCGSADGLALAERLARRLGSTLRIERFERKNALRVVSAIPLSSLRRGDAVIAFTRNAVVGLQAQVGRSGLSTAAIYGSLSPAVRRREAERFRNGAADVLVATDAVGLGLNLPIRRLIFAAIEKYDGLTTRLLRPAEIRQIAGRAGRYGIHEAGEVSALSARDVAIIRASIDRFDEGLEAPIWISPTADHLRRLAAILGTTRVGRLLEFFQTRVLRAEQSDVRIANLSETIDVANVLENSDRFLSLPTEVRFTYVRAPVSTRGPTLGILATWADRHGAGEVIDGRELEVAFGSRDRLLFFEDRSRLATLYLWLAQRFPNVYRDDVRIARERERIDAGIGAALIAQGAHEKKKVVERRPKRPGPPVFNKRKLPKTKR